MILSFKSEGQCYYFPNVSHIEFISNDAQPTKPDVGQCCVAASAEKTNSDCTCEPEGLQADIREDLEYEKKYLQDALQENERLSKVLEQNSSVFALLDRVLFKD